MPEGPMESPPSRMGKDGPCGDSRPGCPAPQVYRAAGLCFRIVILAEQVGEREPTSPVE